MTHQDLLKVSLSASKYYLRSKSPSEVNTSLHGYTVDDLSMDTIEKLLISKVSLEDLPKSYVWLTVRSVFIDLIRKQDPMRDLGVLKEADEAYEPLFSRDMTEVALVQELSEELRELYGLSYMDGFSDEEIGGILGISGRTVRRKLVPLKLKVQEYLSGDLSSN